MKAKWIALILYILGVVATLIALYGILWLTILGVLCFILAALVMAKYKANERVL